MSTVAALVSLAGNDCNRIAAFAATMRVNHQTSRHCISSSILFVRRLLYSRSSTLRQKFTSPISSASPESSQYPHLLVRAPRHHHHLRQAKHRTPKTITRDSPPRDDPAFRNGGHTAKPPSTPHMPTLRPHQRPLYKPIPAPHDLLRAMQIHRLPLLLRPKLPLPKSARRRARSPPQPSRGTGREYGSAGEDVCGFTFWGNVGME
jgi:hypothetical protein